MTSTPQPRNKNIPSRVRFSIPSNFSSDEFSTEKDSNKSSGTVVFPTKSTENFQDHFMDIQNKINIEVPHEFWNSHNKNKNKNIHIRTKSEASINNTTGVPRNVKYQRSQSLQSVIANTINFYHSPVKNVKTNMCMKTPLKLPASHLYLRSDSPLNKYKIPIPLEITMPPYLCPENKHKRRSSLVYDGEGYSIFLGDGEDIGTNENESIDDTETRSESISDISIPSAINEFSFVVEDNVDHTLGIDEHANVNLKLQVENLLRNSSMKKHRKFRSIQNNSRSIELSNVNQNIRSKPNTNTALEILSYPSETIHIPDLNNIITPVKKNCPRYSPNDIHIDGNNFVSNTQVTDQLNPNFKYPVSQSQDIKKKIRPHSGYNSSLHQEYKHSRSKSIHSIEEIFGNKLQSQEKPSLPIKGKYSFGSKSPSIRCIHESENIPPLQLEHSKLQSKESFKLPIQQSSRLQFQGPPELPFPRISDSPFQKPSKLQQSSQLESQSLSKILPQKSSILPQQPSKLQFEIPSGLPSQESSETNFQKPSKIQLQEPHESQLQQPSKLQFQGPPGLPSSKSSKPQSQSQEPCKLPLQKSSILPQQQSSRLKVHSSSELSSRLSRQELSKVELQETSKLKFQQSSELQSQKLSEVSFIKPSELSPQKPSKLQPQEPSILPLQESSKLQSQESPTLQLKQPSKLQLQRPSDIPSQKLPKLKSENSPKLLEQQPPKLQSQRPSELSLQKLPKSKLQQPYNSQVQELSKPQVLHPNYPVKNAGIQSDLEVCDSGSESDQFSGFSFTYSFEGINSIPTVSDQAKHLHNIYQSTHLDNKTRKTVSGYDSEPSNISNKKELSSKNTDISKLGALEGNVNNLNHGEFGISNRNLNTQSTSIKSTITPKETSTKLQEIVSKQKHPFHTLSTYHSFNEPLGKVPFNIPDPIQLEMKDIIREKMANRLSPTRQLSNNCSSSYDSKNSNYTYQTSVSSISGPANLIEKDKGNRSSAKYVNLDTVLPKDNTVWNNFEYRDSSSSKTYKTGGLNFIQIDEASKEFKVIKEEHNGKIVEVIILEDDYDFINKQLSTSSHEISARDKTHSIDIEFCELQTHVDKSIVLDPRNDKIYNKSKDNSLLESSSLVLDSSIVNSETIIPSTSKIHYRKGLMDKYNQSRYMENLNRRLRSKHQRNSFPIMANINLA